MFFCIDRRIRKPKMEVQKLKIEVRWVLCDCVKFSWHLAYLDTTSAWDAFNSLGTFPPLPMTLMTRCSKRDSEKSTKRKSLAIFRSAMFPHEVGGKLTVWSDGDSQTGSIEQHSHLPRQFFKSIHSAIGLHTHTESEESNPFPTKRLVGFESHFEFIGFLRKILPSLFQGTLECLASIENTA